MSAPQRLTDAQIAFARDIHRKRAEAYRRVRMFPTDEQLAEQLGCSRRYLQKILAGQARSVSPRNAVSGEQ